MRAIVRSPWPDETTQPSVLISLFFHVFVHLSVGPSVSVFMCEQQETEGREAAVLTSPYHLQLWVKWRDNCRSKYQQWKWRSVSDTAAWLALDHRHSGWLAHGRQWVTLLILDRRQVGAGVWSGGEAEVIVCNLGEIQHWRHKLHSVFLLLLLFGCSFATVTQTVTLRGGGWEKKANWKKRKQCQHPNRKKRHKMAALRYTLQRMSEKFDSWDKRVGGEDAHKHNSPSLSLDLWFPAEEGHWIYISSQSSWQKSFSFTHLIKFTSD